MCKCTSVFVREKERERERRRAQVTAAYAKHSENIHSAFGEQGTHYALGIQFRLWLKAMSWLCVWLSMSGSVCSLHLSFFFSLMLHWNSIVGGSGLPSCTPPHLCPRSVFQQPAPRCCVSACFCRPGRRCKSPHRCWALPSSTIPGVSYTKPAPLLISEILLKKHLKGNKWEKRWTQVNKRVVRRWLWQWETIKSNL